MTHLRNNQPVDNVDNSKVQTNAFPLDDPSSHDQISKSATSKDKLERHVSSPGINLSHKRCGLEKPGDVLFTFSRQSLYTSIFHCYGWGVDPTDMLATSCQFNFDSCAIKNLEAQTTIEDLPSHDPRKFLIWTGDGKAMMRFKPPSCRTKSLNKHVCFYLVDERSFNQ